MKRSNLAKSTRNQSQLVDPSPPSTVLIGELHTVLSIEMHKYAQTLGMIRSGDFWRFGVFVSVITPEIVYCTCDYLILNYLVKYMQKEYLQSITMYLVCISTFVFFVFAIS